MKRAGVQSISAFLANQDSRQAWLEAEKIALESAGSYFSHWGTNQHLGLVITGPVVSGEFHAQADGTISFYVERSLGETIKSARVQLETSADSRSSTQSFV